MVPRKPPAIGGLQVPGGEGLGDRPLGDAADVDQKTWSK
jgi:hypothetical protein